MLAANEIKVDTNELVQILTLNKREILELDSPFGCGEGPLFTYPFFGEDQLIALAVPSGTPESTLESLEIVLCLDTNFESIASCGCDCYLGVSDEIILKDARDRIESKLKEMADACEFSVKFHHSWREYQATIKARPDESIDLNEIADGVVSLENAKKDRQFYNKIQLLLPFFIEAATPIDLRDPKWSIYLLQSGGNCIQGLLTAYSYFRFPEGQRVRISQVLVFPRYQSNRLGTKLYRSVTRALRFPGNDCVEICVEDPTDGFERLRGLVDWKEAEMAGIWTDFDDARDKLIKEMKLTEEHSDRLINLNKCLQSSSSIPSNPKRSKPAAIDADDESTKLRQEIKRWLLKKYRKELPEGKVERIGKLSELYEAELIEFIEPLTDLLKS